MENFYQLSQKKYNIYIIKNMVKLDIEHVLILVIVAFVLYHLMNRCSCFNNGFSVGGGLQEHYKCADHGWFHCNTYGKERCVWRGGWSDGKCIER